MILLKDVVFQKLYEKPDFIFSSIFIADITMYILITVV